MPFFCSQSCIEKFSDVILGDTMFIPRYWKRIEAIVETKDYVSAEVDLSSLPETMDISSWGYSDTSEGEAEKKAHERINDIMIALSKSSIDGDFYYPFRVMNEEILKTFEGEDTEQAIITRNKYHCQILNTAQLMFIDIDVDVSDLRPPSLLSRILFRSSQIIEENKKKEKERYEAVVSKIENFVRKGGDGFDNLGLLIYRTFAGFRVIVSSRPLQPRGEDTHKIFDALGTDPLYQNLCRTQNSFRARLTPKSWRMGSHIIDKLTPYPLMRRRVTKSMLEKWTNEDGERLRHYDEWVKAYEALHKSYSTCHFVKQVGNYKIDPSLKGIIDFHDEMTGAFKKLDLA